jgi:hypothetical protein
VIDFIFANITSSDCNNCGFLDVLVLLLIAVKLNAEPVNMLIVQVDMPTSYYEDEEMKNYMRE